jgi:hypothetical protein
MARTAHTGQRSAKRLRRLEQLEARALLHGGPPNILPETTVVGLGVIDPFAAETTADQEPNLGRLVVHRFGPLDAALVVNYTVSGDATSGSDYEALTGSVEIAAGERSAEIVITPIDDADAEPHESVRVQLSADPAYQLAHREQSAAVIIRDNDSQPHETPLVSVRSADPLAAETTADQEPNLARFVVSRRGPTDAALVVHYTLNGSATNGEDYTALPLSIEIPAGEASAVIEVVPTDDDLVEGPERVSLVLSASDTYRVNHFASRAGAVLFDNDRAAPSGPIVSIRTVDLFAKETTGDQASNTGRMVVHRSGPTDAPLVVHYTVAGSATPDADYSALSGSIEIPAGAASAEIEVVPLDDDLVESFEHVRVELAADAAYRVNRTRSAAGVVIVDNDHVTPPPVDPADPPVVNVPERPGAVLVDAGLNGQPDGPGLRARNALFGRLGR